MTQFYDFLQNRVLVQFKLRHDDPSGRTADFEIVLSKKMTYEVVSLIPSHRGEAEMIRWPTELETL